MNKLICSLLITAMALLSSCQDDIAITTEELNTSDITENPYSISEESVQPILPEFTDWTQHSPFNDLYPKSKSNKRRYKLQQLHSYNNV